MAAVVCHVVIEVSTLQDLGWSLNFSNAFEADEVVLIVDVCSQIGTLSRACHICVLQNLFDLATGWLLSLNDFVGNLSHAYNTSVSSLVRCNLLSENLSIFSVLRVF